MFRFWQGLRAALKKSIPSRRRQQYRLQLDSLEDRCLPSSSALPNVTFHGGPLLQNVQVENIYYGQPWTTDAALKSTITQTDAFLKYFVTSPYMDVLKQYNVNSGTFLNKDDIINQNPANNTIDDTQIRQIIDGEITAGNVAPTSPNQLYIFYTAPSVVVTASGQNSTSNFAGYHDTFVSSGGAAVYYAVIPYPTGGVGVGLTAFQQSTIVLSHELAEAITDPDTQTGWFDPRYGEISDISNGLYGLLNNYVVAGVWSQTANKVVLPGPTTTTGLQMSGVPITAVAGQPTTAIVATITNAPAGTTTTTFTATIDWGDGNTSTGTITTDPNGGFDVVGTNTYSLPGTFAVTVSIKDSTSTLAGSVLTKAKVAAAAPTVQPTGTLFSATFGQEFTGTVATFVDANPAAALANYTATINWGDGTSSAGTITQSGSGFVISGSHTYATSTAAWWGSASGTGKRQFVVNVTVNDTPANSSASVFSLATVTPAVPVIAATGVNIAAVTGQAFTGVVATFTTTIAGATAADFTATINWGNGTSSAGTVAANAAGGFVVTGTNTYSNSSRWWGFGRGGKTYLITVSITDTLTQDQGKAASTANVAATTPNLSVAAQNIKAVVGQSFSGVVATFRDNSAALIAANYTATINWGDGTSSAGTVTANPSGGFDVSGTHTYNSASTASSLWGLGASLLHGGLTFGPGTGTFALSVTVSNTSSSTTGTSQAGATVTPAVTNLQATGTIINTAFGSSFTGSVATFTTPLSVTGWTVTINWGDGQSSAGAIVAAGSNFSITGTHTYGNSAFGGWQSRFGGSGPQPFLISVIINAISDNSTATVTSLASVAPKPPVMSAKPVNLTLSPAVAFSGTVASFTDSDTIGASAFTATISWGDGTSSAGTITPNPSGGWLVGGAHTYNKLGSFAVFVRILDANGNSAVSIGKASVVDNPSFGALTGVAYAFLHSYEYRSQIITKHYQQLLGRTPSITEVNGWVAAMQTGITSQLVMAGFLGSQEYYVSAGNTNAAWLAALYRGVLGRSADAGGLNGWLQNLSTGNTRANIALAFVNGTEYEGLLVQNYYQRYLNRTASKGEIAVWTTAYQTGLSDSQINAMILVSPEYYQRVNANASDWLRGTYTRVLGRTAGQLEIDGWLKSLGVA